MAISDWPLAERPRERLLAQGAGSLSDAELLAVILRTGLPGKSAVELGRDLLERFKSVAGLFAADLSDVKGQLQAKRALEIAAAGQDSLLILCWPRPARATDRRNIQRPARVEGAALQGRPVAAV